MESRGPSRVWTRISSFHLPDNHFVRQPGCSKDGKGAQNLAQEGSVGPRLGIGLGLACEAALQDRVVDDL